MVSFHTVVFTFHTITKCETLTKKIWSFAHNFLNLVPDEGLVLAQDFGFMKYTKVSQM